jgi:hypothetical protein
MNRRQPETGGAKILRASCNGKWRELKQGVVVQCAENGIVIRECARNLLIADIPRSAVTGVTVVDDHFAAVKLGDSGVALKFSNRVEFTNLMNVLQRWNLRIEHATPQQIERQLAIPNIQDPEVQSLIVKLLFSEEFKGFAQDLKTLITGLQASVP